MGTVNLVPDALEPSYGSRTPAGGLLFLRLRPINSAETHAAMHSMPMPDAGEMASPSGR
jgi:hypothetical protein